MANSYKAWGSRVIAPGGGEPTFTTWGEMVTALVSEAHSGGRFSVSELLAQPGWRRRTYIDAQFDECFYVLDGEFEAELGDRTGTEALRPGFVLYVPSGILCGLRHVGESAGKLLVFTLPHAP